MWSGPQGGKIRKWVIENNYIDRVVNIHGNTFEDTSIATCIVVLKKNRTTTDIIFEDETRTESVSLQTIAENGFVLSVNTYLPEIVEKEEIDPMILESEARQSFLKKLRSELEFEKTVCDMEGISMNPFLKAIKRIVSEFERKEKKEDENQMKLEVGE